MIGHRDGLPQRTGAASPSRRTGDGRDRIRMAPAAAGIERLEAHLHGRAFSPHRHDTYAIGLTLSGVQTFRFRGVQWHCLPGQCHILHPDELHDGSAGTEDGFAYRILHVDPALVQEALGGRPLPFVAEPVVAAAGLLADKADIWDIEAQIDDVARVELVLAAANLVADAARSPRDRPSGPLALAGLRRARDFIAADPSERASMAALERVSGLDRWTLARHFRAAFGTSPSRFRVLRQLDQVRRLLRQGVSAAEAAAEAGFADQSHMSRHFKRCYGFTPVRWTAALSAS